MTMKFNYRDTQVCGISFTTYDDYIDRATYAIDNSTGITKAIKTSGYLGNDLSIRKAIAIVFGLPSFRK